MQAHKRFFSILFITAFSFAMVTVASAQTETPPEAPASTEPAVEATPAVDPAPEPAAESRPETEAASPAEDTEVPAPAESGIPSTAEEERLNLPEEENNGSQEASEEALEDETITEEDLGADRALILPDNPLYTLKRIGRDVRRVFIFDDAKKVEQEIKDANQELADLNRLLDEKGEEVSDVVLRGFERVEEHFESIADRAPDLAEEDEESRREVMEHLLDSEIKRQKVFEHIEREAKDERVLERAQELREHMMDRVGDVVEDVEVDADVFDRILQNQEGSEFKDLRNLEVLKRLEEKVPEQAREGIQRAEENAFKRLHEQMGEFKDADSRERFENYMEQFGGDEVIRYDILDRFENSIDEQNIPEEVREKIKKARDLSARIFQNRFEEMQERVQDDERRERMRERMMDRFRVEDGSEQEFEGGFVDDMSERLELMAKFKANLQSPELEEEMKKTEEQEMNKFVEAFPDARQDAESARRAMEELRQAGRSGDFEKVKLLEKVLADLEEKQMQDPNKRAFMEQLDTTRREAEKGFMEHLRENGEKAFDEMISDDPQQMEFLKMMKEKFMGAQDEFGGEQFDPSIFDRAMKEQFEHITGEERRRAEELRNDEMEFRARAEKEREDIRFELEKKMREADTQEERQAIENSWKQKEQEFIKQQDEQELDIFRRQWDAECRGDAGCETSRKAEYEKKMQMFEERRRAEEEVRGIERELREFVEEKKREEFRAVEPVRDGEQEKMEFRFKEELDGERFEFRKEIKDGEERTREEFRSEPRFEPPKEFREEFREEKKEEFRKEFREEKMREEFKEEKREEFREEFRDDFREEKMREEFREMPREEFREEKREEFREEFREEIREEEREEVREEKREEPREEVRDDSGPSDPGPAPEPAPAPESHSDAPPATE